MAIMMIIEVPGGTVEQYDRANEIMGIRGDDDAPDGLISHVAGKTEDGLLVVDLWESEQALNRFMQERLGAALQQSGMPDARPRMLPVHNHIPAARDTNAGVIVLIEFDGLGTEQYDQLTSHMPAHVRDGSDHPAVSHAFAPTDGGAVVVDVWGSPEEFGQFAESQVAPAMSKAGLGGRPIEPRFIPVYNHMRGRSAVRG
jgi:hypothetical protein